MFDISGWEFITLAIIAVIIFGPDRLPKAAADAGKFIRQVRGYVHNAKDDFTRELGPEFADVKISDFTPRGVLRKTFGPEDPFDDIRKDLDIRNDVDIRKDIDGLKASDIRKDLGKSLSASGAKAPLRAGEVPPFDPDAT